MHKISTLGKVLFSLLAALLLYDVASSIFYALPRLVFLSHGIYAPLATLIIGLSIKDFFDERQIVDMIDKGEFINIPAIMSALQKTDKGAYKRVMKSQLSMLKNRTKEYEDKIEKERERAFSEFKKNGKLNFDVREQTNKLYADQSFLETIERIDSGEYTWEKMYEDVQMDSKKWYLIRYLLNRIPEEELKNVDAIVNNIKTMTAGGNKFIIKEGDKEY